ncbi:hypothetical protein FRC02_007427 [Tulasnella sp. 418]|nr:hypothetical protein FRC02_007427 [Tulasnella sp. 418]
METGSLAAANLFWAFDFSAYVSDVGGLSNDPLPFKCKITTRSIRRAELIKQNYTQFTPVFEKFERELSKEDREHIEKVRAKHHC